jgi:RNA polymerase sigma-70 factor (ECF subfamily)
MPDWENIVSQHGSLVWHTAYRLVGCEADAADCYQEAFAAALTISRRETVRNWPALLQKLVTVHALDRLRRRSKDSARQSLLADLDGVASRSREPLQIAQERELIEWLRTELGALPEMQAQVFSLVCIGDLSYRDAAEQLGIDSNCVAVLLHRARSRLRDRLNSQDGKLE